MPEQERMTVAQFKALPAKEKRGSRGRGPKEDPKGTFLFGLAAAGIPAPETEVYFHPNRQWRFDFAWPCRCGHGEGKHSDPANRFMPACLVEHCPCTIWRPIKLAVEYNGIFGGEGENASHSSVGGLMRDYRKLNEAVLLGWRVILIDAKSVADGDAVRWVELAYLQAPA